ncbi:CNTN3 [Mytilus edulis]|uniref:CNTN3 n=1 Tax=Mytilus edulis TaxID=6550 RepID=A0A8S3QUY0_MYTED|nr:CNTN3 [Mytilus edulis]
MYSILLYIIVYELAVIHGNQRFFKKDMYAQIGSEIILPCEIPKDTSPKSWRKGLALVTRGFKINRNVRGYGRLKVITDTRSYNLKISNVTKYDFGTYWCETQQGNSISAEGTQLINLGNGQSFYYWLFAIGLAVLCLSVGCNLFINKLRVVKRRERNLDGNGHHDMLQRNGTNNTTAFDTAMEQNDNVFPHYESIYENEIVEMSHPTTSVNLSNLPCASSKKNVEDTNIQILNKKKSNKRRKYCKQNTQKFQKTVVLFFRAV